MNAVQVIIQPDWANLRRINRVVTVAAVSDGDLAGQLLVQIHTIQTIHILHHIEIGDIDDIVTIQLGADIYGNRISGAAQQRDRASVGLLRTLGITLGAAGGDVTDIGLTGADAADRALMHLGQNLTDPALVGGQQFWSAWLNVLVFREQLRDCLLYTARCV